jgi:hypothetical protein
VQRRDDRHFEFAQQRQDVPAGRTAEDTELVLQADHVHVADVQKVGGAQIRGKILLLDLEANRFWIFIDTPEIVDGHGETLR